MKKLKLYAPRNGVVIGLPAPDELGKKWDRDQQTTVFCSVGNKSKLRVVVPLSPADYALLKDNLEKQRGTLEIAIRVQGHDSQTWEGKVSQLPQADAKDIPPQLSTKAGGPLAVKPISEPGKIAPQGQWFLVGVDFVEPDDTIAINSHAQVKFHNEYRSCAWWAYRAISNAFDLGLWRW
jgi:hypothetical protein